MSKKVLIAIVGVLLLALAAWAAIPAVNQQPSNVKALTASVASTAAASFTPSSGKIFTYIVVKNDDTTATDYLYFTVSGTTATAGTTEIKLGGGEKFEGAVTCSKVSYIATTASTPARFWGFESTL